MLHNNLHRLFDPTPGRWLSQAPISFAADNHNLRPYVVQAPEPSPSR